MQQNTLTVVSNGGADHLGPTYDDSAEADRSVALGHMLRPFDAYLSNDQVREITVPNPGKVFLRIAGAWQEQADLPALNLNYLEGLAATMASFNKVNFEPIQSLTLKGGERVQVMRPPAVIEGSFSLNIRKFSSVVKSLDDLAGDGAFERCGATDAHEGLSAQDQELLELKRRGNIREFLERAVLYRKNIIIGGKTGSGKTTFARSLIEVVPTSERLITIEDVHELFLPNHPNKVHMMYGAGEGQVTATECVAACMRSSPDRIFLSELREAEAAWEYLSGLNTGHPGSVTTTHANSALDTFTRLALLIKQSRAGNQIDMATIRSYLHSTLDIALFYKDYKLVEIYFDPERAAAII